MVKSEQYMMHSEVSDFAWIETDMCPKWLPIKYQISSLGSTEQPIGCFQNSMTVMWNQSAPSCFVLDNTVQLKENKNGKK